MHSFLVVTYETIQRFLFSLPRFSIFCRLKTLFLKMNGAVVGKHVVFYPGVWITPGRNLVIGDSVDIALNVVITTSGGVEIGDRTLIGYNTHIFSANHRILSSDTRIIDSGHEFKKVTIGKDVWIGAGSIILPGITIGDGVVIGAGSVVTKDIPSFAVAVGNPAKVVRQR